MIFTAKKLLIAVLAFSAAAEFLFSAAGFLAPELVLQKFGVAVSPDTLFLGYVIAWFLLAVTVVCAYALKLVMGEYPQGHALARILGFWWIGIGLALFIRYGRVDNLFLDAVKGSLIVGLSIAARRTRA